MRVGRGYNVSLVMFVARKVDVASPFPPALQQSPWADLYFAMRAGAMRMESCRRWILEHMSIPDQELIESYLLFCLVRLCWGGRLCILLRLFPSQRYFSPPHLPSAESVLLLVAVPFSPTIAALQILSSAWYVYAWSFQICIPTIPEHWCVTMRWYVLTFPPPWVGCSNHVGPLHCEWR